MVLRQDLRPAGPELVGHQLAEHGDAHRTQGSDRPAGYRDGMTSAQEMPSWGPAAMTVASAAVLIAALVVALRALWNTRNRK
ncbi:hypothetical protein GCM10017786_44860 [Amycolatopsis deserti]|uniref:Uncharacterized protein n=1 Tax=Amycolatopsis deserti TaxID=185696 RepID=A0ABQ3J5Y7_9PSEU|nr:hypothetical protein GCM10017786_44860 [Amycolatopsis deserti]